MNKTDEQDGDFLGEISKVSAYQMREGQILSEQDSKEHSAASQIYDELKSSYANLVEQVTSSSEGSYRDYKEVRIHTLRIMSFQILKFGLNQISSLCS